MILWIDSTDSFNSIQTLKCTLSLKDNFNKIIKNLQNAKKSGRVERSQISYLENIEHHANLLKYDILNFERKVDLKINNLIKYKQQLITAQKSWTVLNDFYKNNELIKSKHCEPYPGFIQYQNTCWRYCVDTAHASPVRNYHIFRGPHKNN